MANYLITGGCGFIGSHLADALVADGHGVRILDDLSTGRIGNAPAAAEVMVGDVADPSAVSTAMVGIDGCFHLAAVASVQRSNEDWLGTHRTNLTGTITVFDAARRCRTPVIYASSAAVYGNPAHLPIPESAPISPLTAYGADKLGSELHARVAGLVHGVPSAGFRFFNVYGPRQDPSSPYSGVISIFTDRLRAGLPVTIYGDGTQIRDFIHVSDVVAHLLAGLPAATPAAPIFNACTGRATTVRQLADLLLTLTNSGAAIRHAPPRDGDIRASLGSPDLAESRLDVRAAIPLAAGLRHLLDHPGQVAVPPLAIA